MRDNSEFHEKQISIQDANARYVTRSCCWENGTFSLRSTPKEGSVKFANGLHEHVLALNHQTAFMKTTVGGSTFERVQAPNRLMFLPAGMPYKSSWELLNSEQSRSVTHLALHPSLFSQLAESLDCMPHHFQPRVNVENRPILEALNFFHHFTSEESIPSQLLIDTVIQNVAAQVLVSLSPDHKKLRRTMQRSWLTVSIGRVRRAIEFLHDSSNRNPSLSDIASSEGLSVFYFSRIFREATGMTPYQYQLTIRIERTKQLLRRKPNMALAEIAVACGFSDQAHMTRMFRQRLGVTPAIFREGC